MKPTKKQNADSSNNQKQIGENEQSKIKTYFKSAPKSFVVEERKKVDDQRSEAKEFYVRILKERLRNVEEPERSSSQADGACAMVEKTDEHVSDVTNKLQSSPVNDIDPNVECQNSNCVQKTFERDEWQEKYKELKKLYMKLTIRHSELDLKYSDLLKMVTGRKYESSDGNVAGEQATDDIFTPNELKFLQCMATDKKKDSTFIHQCLQFAYKSDPSVLVLRSLKGTSDWIEITGTGDEKHHPAKDPLSPHKVNRIKEIFVERISKCDINSVDYGERVKDSYINKLFASGIKNISKKQN